MQGDISRSLSPRAATTEVHPNHLTVPAAGQDRMYWTGVEEYEVAAGMCEQQDVKSVQLENQSPV